MQCMIDANIMSGKATASSHVCEACNYYKLQSVLRVYIQVCICSTKIFGWSIVHMVGASLTLCVCI